MIGAGIEDAALAERRRLERNLHDGTQQRLVTLALAVRHAQRLIADDPAAARRALDGVVDEVTATLAELRSLVSGQRPQALRDGLGAALADVARRAPVPVDLAVDEAGVAGPVAEAAYFVACEAITNALKHAEAENLSVRAIERGGVLYLEVADDGVGGAHSRPGGGLTGLSDRVAAHGGRLRVASTTRGTTIHAEMPCAS